MTVLFYTQIAKILQPSWIVSSNKKKDIFKIINEKIYFQVYPT